MAKKTAKKAGIPLKLRLKTWWEGYDQDEVAKRVADRQPQEEASTDTAAAKKKAAAAAAKAAEEEAKTESGLDVDPWDTETVDVAQYIWGDGFCGPGGPEYIIGMSKLLALSPEMSMTQLGASIGGPARTLADRFGVWVTGYEESETLVNAGNELSKMGGLAKKAVLEVYDPDGDDFQGFDRKFDRALSKEALFTIKNKKDVISSIGEKLKPGGLFLITDYVIGNDSITAKDSYQSWKVGERTTPYPVMADDLVEMLKEARLQVRVSEDISIQYVEMINKAWAGADQVAAKLAKQENGARLIQVLMREAEFWTRRKKMLESGDLKLWRIVANQKSNGPSMMSDW